MKYRILVLALVTLISVQAQEQKEETKDKIVETKTKIIKVKEDGKIVEKKIMVKTIKEQEIKTDPNYKGTIDAPRVFPATKVTKVIYIDNDNDPFYDKQSTLTYYKKDGMIYNFNSTDSGFEITNQKSNKRMGNARYSMNSNVYLMDTDDYSGIGYFKDNQFIIEYYDNEGTLIIEKFNDSKL